MSLIKRILTWFGVAETHGLPPKLTFLPDDCAALDTPDFEMFCDDCPQPLQKTQYWDFVLLDTEEKQLIKST